MIFKTINSSPIPLRSIQRNGRKSRRVGCKKYANDAKKCSFLNYPVRARMLVDVNKFVREERAVRYATFSRHILSLAGQQRWRWVKFFTNILSL